MYGKDSPWFDGFEHRFTPELPADCERPPVSARLSRRPVYYTSGLGYFVLDEAQPDFDRKWHDIQIVELVQNNEWQLRDRAMLNLDALPYFRIVYDDAVIVGA